MRVPDWYPAWARELADLYFSGSICLFVLHGNVHDIIPCPDGTKTTFCHLTEFLTRQVFGNWDVVFSYDLGQGLQVEAGPDGKRRQRMMEYAGSVLGAPKSWPRDADRVLGNWDTVIERNLLESNQSARKRIAFLLEYSQYLVPAGGLSMLARGQASRLVRILSWAENPYIKRVNMIICLISDKLTELNDRLIQNPHVAAIEIPLPDADARRLFVNVTTPQLDTEPAAITETGSDSAALGAQTSSSDVQKGLSVQGMAELSSGLNLVNLNVMLSRARLEKGVIEAEQFRRLKKGMIERQCQGLVTFVEPKHTLETVVGHKAAKHRLRQDAEWLASGRLDTSPMGYLVCGPVGTGKTFLAHCYAGSIGIPCVTLGNFRSKYVGETEGNLSQVLNVLRSLGPVVVIIDEADAALGNREADGDSGTSGRVFSMIARQMGNTDFRGRIIWMLLTSRPDLLPIDLKRQGRAEVHIPLFYPQDDREVAKMFQVMARKNRISLESDTAPKAGGKRNLSGADIESIVLASRRRALSEGRDVVSPQDLQDACDVFIPSAQGLEKEIQELVAVLECTDRSFLPIDWQKKIDEQDGRSRLQERLKTLREIVT